MQVIYALEPFPTEVSQTLFLGGPTPRQGAESWRTEALRILEEKGYKGHVFIPEPKGGAWAEDYNNQIDWEDRFLKAADVILFWVPRDLQGNKKEGNGAPMPALTTNDEWGVWKDSGKVVWGAPSWADHHRYQKSYASKLKVPAASTLEKVIDLALEKLGEPSSRKGFPAQIPSYVWDYPPFQKWYKSQTDSGNEVRALEVLQAFWSEKKDKLFTLTIHPEVWIASEDRVKSNEMVVLRSDISVVALYKPDPQTPSNSKFVLIKEFRAAVRNSESMVYELPGGSSPKEGADPLQTAAEEVSEEVGLKLEPSRLKSHGSRQMGATMVSYHANFYSAQLTDEELAQLEADDSVHGANNEEKTYITVRTLGDILKDNLVDWPMLGMIFGTFTEQD